MCLQTILQRNKIRPDCHSAFAGRDIIRARLYDAGMLSVARADDEVAA